MSAELKLKMSVQDIGSQKTGKIQISVLKFEFNSNNSTFLLPGCPYIGVKRKETQAYRWEITHHSDSDLNSWSIRIAE